MFQRLAALAIVLLTAPALAAADDSEDGFSRPGWYAGLGVAGQIYFLKDLVEEDSQGLLTVTDTVGLNARAGYRLASWFALEADFEWAPGFELEATQTADLGVIDPTLPTITEGSSILTLTGYTLTANAKFLLPIWRFQPYLLLGLGGSIVDVEGHFGLSDTTRGAVAGRLAVGGDFYITKNLLAFVEFEALLTTLDLGDVTSSDSISLLYYISPQAGLQWRF